MIIIPAIDLKDGKCVRLRQGVANDCKVYADDPVKMALHWQAEGAEYLHVVDLDGAFQGRPVHTGIIGKIAAAVDIPVEAGGGLRSDVDIRALLEAGAARAIIGTKALSDRDGFRRMIAEFKDRIAAGIDARGGLVQVKGWVATTDVAAVDFAASLSDMGVRTIIYTDTARDGMLGGVNAAEMKKICEAVSCDVIASGGVAGREDVRVLKELECRNLSGVIVGKALYEGCVALADLAGELREGKN